jgi:hypothetical protein
MIGSRERLVMDSIRCKASSPSAIALKHITVVAFTVMTFTLCVTTAALAQGGACSQCGPGPHWVDSCSAGRDQIANSGAVVGIDGDMDPGCVPEINLVMWPCSSPDNLLVIDRSGPRDDSQHFPGLRPLDGHPDVIDTEIISMCLTRNGFTLRAGAGRQHGPGVLAPSLGAIAEQPGHPTLADSFFDVFFEVELPPGFPVQFLYNQTALRVTATIDCAPPEAEYVHPTDCIPLYTSPIPGQGMHVANLVSARHEVNVVVGVNPNAAVAPAVVSSLAQAYPNPTNPIATISYTVGALGKVTLRVFDVTGRVIRTLVDATKATGAYSVIWDGTNDRGEKVASGVFFYQLEAPGFKSAKKLVILQ